MSTITTTEIATKKITKPVSLLSPGHRACAGCGQLLAAKTVINTIGKNAIIANATGCLEVTTTPFPESSWGVPWIHSLFENPAAVATGVLAALRVKGLDGKTKVVVQGGDGGMFDIGFGIISGAWERRENILFITYDNEAYSNTGMQASGATPIGSSTTTAPSGSTLKTGGIRPKKDMVAIALAHGLNYVAQTTTGFIGDIEAKIKKALTIDGPAYIQILAPCVPGWRIKSDQAVSSGKLAAQTGLYPCLEYINGELTGKMKVPAATPKVDEYLKMQGRFGHLFKTPEGLEAIKQIQTQADKNIVKYGLK